MNSIPNIEPDNSLYSEVIKENIRLGRVIKPTKKQNEVFKLLKAKEGYIIFFGGAKGGGKTALAVGSAVWACKNYPGITVMIVRQTQRQADVNIIEKELLTNRPQRVFGYKWFQQERVARFTNGSRIIFQPIARESDTEKVFGNEFQYLIIDEAPLMEYETIIKMLGSLRGNVENWIPKILMTGNPGGVSYSFFQTYFVNPSKKEDFDYKNNWEERFLKQRDRFKFVYAAPTDNPFLQQSYFDNIEIQDTKTKNAWYGDFDDFQGKFFDEFREDKHVLRGSEQFEIPKNWDRKVGFDLGQATSEDSVRHPTVFEWVAQDPVTQALYVYRELKLNKFYEENIYDIVKLCEGEEISQWFSDPSSFAKKVDGCPNTIPEMFQSVGIYLEKASNDRINGWRALKQWLHWEGEKKPLLYIFGDECPFLVKTMPMMVHNIKGNVEDMNSRRLDDALDSLRYVTFSGFRFPSKDLREELDYNEKIRDKENVQTNFLHQWIAGTFEEPKKSKHQTLIMTRDDVDAFYKVDPEFEIEYDPRKRLENV